MVRIKICGVTTVDDARHAANLGADAVGLNFYPKSPRVVSLATASDIVRTLPPFVEAVGLFVNESPFRVRETAERLGIRTVQWHGEEPEIVYPLRTIPAFAVRDEESIKTINWFLEAFWQEGTGPAAILVDAHVPGLHGGTGQVAPWHLLADIEPGVPLILAGGLTPDNVAEAIHIVKPYAVDVASGVESSPGKKDHEKMKRFIEAVRTA